MNSLTDHMSGSENFSSTSGSRSPSEPPGRPCSRSIAAAAAAAALSPGPAAPWNRASTLASFALSSSSSTIANRQTGSDFRQYQRTRAPLSMPECRDRIETDERLVHDPVRTGFQTLPVAA